MIALWMGKNPIYFGIIRSKVKVTITIHRIVDRIVSAQINRILPLPQGNHVVKVGKDPIYRTSYHVETTLLSKIIFRVTVTLTFDLMTPKYIGFFPFHRGIVWSMILLWKGKNHIYFGVIRSKVKVTITINRIFDNGRFRTITLALYIGSLTILAT
jgi:hypothetical protein